MTLLAKSAYTLSHWERVAAEQPGEGLRHIAWVRRSRRFRPRNIRDTTNFFHHPVKPFFDFIVAEPKLQKAMTFDSGPSFRISCDLIKVLLAIDFDCKTQLETTEIGHESGNGYLPTKLESVAPSVTKLFPKQIFGRRASRSQTSRNSCQPVGHVTKCEDNFSRPQPLTRRLRRHPLPMGEG